jgi:hypothetical protein
LIEFCLPFAELKHIVDGLSDDENHVLLEYPVGDCNLQITIPDESRGAHEFMV